MNIFIGFLVMAAGILITVYSEKVLSTFGRIDFFETHLGAEGGSRLGYKLLGLLLAFIGIMMVTGMIQDVVLWIFGPLFRFNK